MFIDVKFVGESVGHVGEVPDLMKTICILPMLQYQMQVNQIKITEIDSL